MQIVEGQPNAVAKERRKNVLCRLVVSPGIEPAVRAGTRSHLQAEQGRDADPSLVWHDGKYYAFMMYNKDGNDGLAAEHCLLATSADGVHWRDEVQSSRSARGAPAPSSSSAWCNIAAAASS